MRYLILITVLFIGFGCGKDQKPLQVIIPEGIATAEDSAKFDSAYKSICNRLEQRRIRLSSEYVNATASERKKVIMKVRTLLIATMADSVFPCWYGTKWDFNGTTTCPRHGKIACGYFVTTALKQSGFKLDRVYFAQQASSVMINTLCPGKVKTITNHQLNKVIDYMKTQKDGIFIVGLDNHTGFFVKRGTEMNFVDANYLAQSGTQSEPIATSRILGWNGFFMIGDLTGSDVTLEKWIKGEAIK